MDFSQVSHALKILRLWNWTQDCVACRGQHIKWSEVRSSQPDIFVIINEKINFTKIVWLRFNVTNDFWSNTMRLHPCFFTHLIINFFLQFSPGISVKILLKVKYYKELNNLQLQSPAGLSGFNSIDLALTWTWCLNSISSMPAIFTV